MFSTATYSKLLLNAVDAQNVYKAKLELPYQCAIFSTPRTVANWYITVDYNNIFKLVIVIRPAICPNFLVRQFEVQIYLKK